MGRPRFSRADVIAAGAAIITEHGLAGLTLNAVAQRLGVRRPSLYHHVPGGIDELRAAVLEAVTAMPGRDEELPSASDAETLLMLEERSLRRMADAMDAFPDVIPYLATQGRNERRSLEQSDQLLRLLESAGLDTSAPEAFVIVYAYLVGWICAQRQDAAAADAVGFPALAEVLRQGDGLDREEVLMRGFRALLTGLGAPAPNAQPSPSTAPEVDSED